MSWEYDYLRLVTRVIDEGYMAESRAGATHSVPGAMLKVPLDKGFPLLTTRKMYPAGVIGELAGFLAGSTLLSDYEKLGCKYWSDNAANWEPNKGRPESEWQIGRVYGAQWINWRVATERVQPTPKLRNGIVATTLGIANGDGRNAEPSLKAVWGNMIQRCYNPASKNYYAYGARGVYVVDRWLEFKAFAEDVKKLAGWDLKVTKDSKYQLDKDILGDGFAYGPTSCKWVTALDNSPYANTKQYTLQHTSGEVFTFTSPAEFCREHGISHSGLCQLWTGNRRYKTCYGFKLLEVKEIGKFAPINQIANVIESIKKDPLGRRHIVTAWNPAELSLGVLPPCHVLFQFYVRSNELHCCVMMRSVDLCVGLPSDIVLYALLTALVAKDTSLRPASLTFFFGDCHVYHNHVKEFLTKQAIRPIQKSPTLVLAEEASTLTFTPGMVEIKDYHHCEAIKYQFNA